MSYFTTWHKVRAQSQLVEWMNEPGPRADAISVCPGMSLNLCDCAGGRRSCPFCSGGSMVLKVVSQRGWV